VLGTVWEIAGLDFLADSVPPGVFPVVVILAVNTAAAVVLFAYALFQRPGRRATVNLIAWFILLCPLAAPVYLLVSRLIASFYKTQDVDLQDISFSKQREKIVLPPDEEIEINYVPIEDALAFSDIASVRRLIIDVLKNHDRQAARGIAGAINNTDTEVSHYAATAVLDILSDFRFQLQKLLDTLEGDPEDFRTNLEAFEYIHQMLAQNIMKDDERRTTIYIAGEVAENLFQRNFSYMKEEHFLQMTDLLLLVGDTQAAGIWVERAWRYYPDTLFAYKARLHLYFAQSKAAEFLSCLEEIKRSDVTVDKEILDLIRIYADQERGAGAEGGSL